MGGGTRAYLTPGQTATAHAPGFFESLPTTDPRSPRFLAPPPPSVGGVNVGGRIFPGGAPPSPAPARGNVSPIIEGPPPAPTLRPNQASFNGQVMDFADEETANRFRSGQG